MLCVYDILSCCRLTSVCKYFCLYFIGRFAKIYLWNMIVCLFCLLCWDFPNHGTFCIIGKHLMNKDAPSWWHNFWPIEKKLLNIEKKLLKIHLNQKLNLFGNLGMLLVWLESPWWVGFNIGDLETFRLEMCETLNFELLLSLKIQLNYKKWFWKEKLVW
jgi:hypothetical protein